jgi:hypothetical protein
VHCTQKPRRQISTATPATDLPAHSVLLMHSTHTERVVSQKNGVPEHGAVAEHGTRH